MTRKRPGSASRDEAGFTLVDLAVVVVVIGVLAGLGVPRLVRSVERSRAVEAFDYLASVRSAQGRYQARYGTFAEEVADLGLVNSPPRHFAVPAGFDPRGRGASPRDSWSLTLTRAGPSAGYGPYTVTFTEAGFDPRSSTIVDEPADAAINPIRR